MFRRAQLLLVSIAVAMGVLAVLTALIFGHPLVDPDGFLGPGWLRLPLLLGLAFGIDLVPARCGSRACTPAACARSGGRG